MVKVNIDGAGNEWLLRFIKSFHHDRVQLTMLSQESLACFSCRPVTTASRPKTPMVKLLCSVEVICVCLAYRLRAFMTAPKHKTADIPNFETNIAVRKES